MPLNHPLKEKGTEVVGEAKLLLAATNGEKGLIDMKANYGFLVLECNEVFHTNDRLRQKKRKKKETKGEFIYDSNQIGEDFENKGMFISIYIYIHIHIYTHITHLRRRITPARMIVTEVITEVLRIIFKTNQISIANTKYKM